MSQIMGPATVNSPRPVSFGVQLAKVMLASLGYAFWLCATSLNDESSILSPPGNDLGDIRQTLFFASAIISILAYLSLSLTIYNKRLPVGFIRMMPLFGGCCLTGGMACVALGTSITSTALYSFGACISGVGNACLGTSWGRMFGSTRPSQTWFALLLGTAIGTGLYLCIVKLAMVIPYSGQPMALAVEVIATVLTARSWHNTSYGVASLNRAENASCTECASETVTIRQRYQASPTVQKPIASLQKLARMLWRPVLGGALFMFVFGMAGQLATVGEGAINNSDLQDITHVASLLGFLVLLVVREVFKRRITYAALYRIVLPLLVIGLIIVPVALEGTSLLSASLIGLGNNVYLVVLICLILESCYSTHSDGAVVYSMLHGGFIAFSVIGTLVGWVLAINFSSNMFALVIVVLSIVYLLLMAAFVLMPRTSNATVADTAEGQDAVSDADQMTAMIDSVDDAEIAREVLMTNAASDDGIENADIENLRESADMLDTARADALAELYHLTEREKEILRYVAHGRSSTFIAEELSLSPHTVHAHIRHIYEKTGVHSKQELIDLFDME